MNRKVLIIEDESANAYILERYFQAAGYDTHLEFDGEKGLDAVYSFCPDIILLDIMLPKKNGYDVAKEVRKSRNTPIIMMSALSEEKDILKGFDLKIDDYITKPFRVNVLVAKANALLSRYDENKETAKSGDFLLKEGNLSINTEASQVFIKDENIKISKTETSLLIYLIKNKDRNCSRKEIFDAVWSDKTTDMRIVDTYVKKLRNTIIDSNITIETVFGTGYRLEEKK